MGRLNQNIIVNKAGDVQRFGNTPKNHLIDCVQVVGQTNKSFNVGPKEHQLLVRVTAPL